MADLNNIKPRSRWASATAGALLAWAAGISAPLAAQIDLSDAPLYVLEGVDPNLIVTMDDSGSMAWSFMPDSIFTYDDKNRAKSHEFNKIYYNPEIDYLPPLKSDGTSYPNASFTAALRDGFDSSSTTVNLSTSFRPTWYYPEDPKEYAGSSEPAYYYLYDGSGSTNSDSNYDKVVVGASSGPNGTDERQNFANWYSYYRTRMLTARTAASRAFANLNTNVRLSYQAINNHTTLSTLEPFSTSATSFFSFIQNLAPAGSTPLRAGAQRTSTLVRTDDAYRDDPSDNSTAIRSCRQNFHILMTDGYWNGSVSGPGNADNTATSLPTNGYNVTTYSPINPYKDTNSDSLADYAFRDWVEDLRPSMNNNVPTYIVDPNTDFDGDGTVENEDIFWNPVNDPANWQHLVTYTLGMGVNGVLDYPGDYDDLVAGTKSWGATGFQKQENIDDLWHAALNSRGRYFSAGNPEEMVSTFRTILNSIADRTGSSAPLAINSGTLVSTSTVYQARFNTSDWSGELRALPISDGTGNATCASSVPVGQVCTTPVWEASCELDGGSCAATNGTAAGLDWNSDRQIITLNPASGAGVPFRWGDLDSTAGSQTTLLNDGDSHGAARLDFIRGDRSCEQGSSVTCRYDLDGDGDQDVHDDLFRGRGSLLGDLINSNPVYVGPPARLYPSTLESGDYTSFQTTYSSRDAMIYVGANDGMLHGFSATTGIEQFAYVPNAVFANLADLSSTTYSHKNYVDGPLVEGDAYFDSDWHTVLVGALGRGGQGLFALDITDPSTIDETSAASLAMWEFTDEDDADLGYTYGAPSIVRLNNDKWAAVIGNGYNNTEADGAASTSGDAVLFIIDIEDGSVIKKISTGVGANEDPLSLSRPNGLATVTPVDVDGDFNVDYVYAGDLFGNVWKFDVSDSNPNQWGVAYIQGSTPRPVYTATDASNVPQPITTAVKVASHSTGNGVLVYFGTGKYLGQTDLSNSSVQTFYAVWDKGLTRSDLPADRSDLLEQEVEEVNLTQFAVSDARITSNHQIHWHTSGGSPPTGAHLGWYMDLPETGERVHQAPLVRHGRVIFVTVTPSDDPCSSGGTSWLMEIDAADGSRLSISPFDYNNDGVIDGDDRVQSTRDLDNDGTAGGSGDITSGSGIRFDNKGILTSPVITAGPGQDETKMMSTSTGAIVSIQENTGLAEERSWRQIR